jgi:hypothetical protein
MTRRQRQQREGRLTEQAPPHHQEERACARDKYCKEAAVRWEDDDRIAEPKLGYRAFCETDRADIVTALTAFPGQYRQLRADLYQIRASGQLPGAAFGSRLPLYADIDAAARRMHFVLTSWEARVRGVPRIDVTAPGEADDGGDPDDGLAAEVRQAAEILHRNVDAMLALDSQPMIRYLPAARLRDDMLIAMPAAHPTDYWDERRKVLVGDLRVFENLDGARAGLEILHLDYRVRLILGQIEGKPDNLPGIACYRCHYKALRRADTPRTDDEPLWYSQCKVCGHQMSEIDYREHVTRLAAMTGGRKITPALTLPAASCCSR